MSATRKFARCLADVEREHAMIALQLKAPKRAEAGRVIEAQADVDHLPLFVAANEPTLF